MNLKEKYRYLYRFKKYKSQKKRLIFNRKKRAAIILMGAPEYGNLGDHAIAFATRNFMTDNFNNFDYFEITENDILFSIREVQQLIKEDDILLLQGGGNFGDLYPDQNKIRDIVLNSFKRNKKIMMPQTIYFSNEEILSPNFCTNSLVLCAREYKSYEIMNRVFNGKVLYTPDIVLSLFNKIPITTIEERSGVLLCLRDDKERNTNINIEKSIQGYLDKRFNTIEKVSTVLDHDVLIEQRERELEKLIIKFSLAELIITDRLHGMIIAAITKTPCIVFSTFNHKITESFEWVRSLGFIELCEDTEHFESCVKQVLLRNYSDVLSFDEYFEPLLMEMKRYEKIY